MEQLTYLPQKIHQVFNFEVAKCNHKQNNEILALGCSDGTFDTQTLQYTTSTPRAPPTGQQQGTPADPNKAKALIPQI